ncbi:MAG: hypothetical protein KA794_10550 [Candidatus Obscuribacter sp.]|nr:hypothetical protein [Candidatus Obscuribacter sp.]MBP7577132.1 hypothetical protein [Candidatus Obscuribacter sp.]
MSLGLKRIFHLTILWVFPAIFAVVYLVIQICWSLSAPTNGLDIFDPTVVAWRKGGLFLIPMLFYLLCGSFAKALRRQAVIACVSWVLFCYLFCLPNLQALLRQACSKPVNGVLPPP